MTGRVYVLAPHTKSMANAGDFGEVRVIYGDDRHRPGMWRGDEYYREAIRRMEVDGYCPDRDHFAVVGSQVQTALFCAVLQQRYPGTRVLVFDSVTGEYVSRPLGLVERSVTV